MEKTECMKPAIADLWSSPEVQPWDTGIAVIELQELLNAHGYRRRIEGDFGSKTENAVRNFQAHHGLRADCVVKPDMWLILKQTVQPGTRLLKLGRSGKDVYELQGLLQVNGYSVERSGVFDEATRMSVMEFQTRCKLKVNGVVGRMVWALLRGQPLPPLPPRNAYSSRQTTSPYRDTSR